MLFPGQLATSQAGCESFGGISGSSHTVHDSCAKFSHVMRCKISGVFTDLGPNELNRIEFGSTSRIMIDMQARMLSNEILNEFTFVDGMVIPDQNDLTRNNPQYLLQESYNLFAAQAVPVRLRSQLDLAAIRLDQQCTQQVQPLVMRQAGTNGRRMSTWRPTAFERRDQREAAFIFKYQRGQQLTPLFLSLAIRAASRKQWLPRHVGSPAAAVSGCSSPCDPSHARHRWVHTEPQTDPRSHARSAPASSNLLHTHGHMLRATTLAPTVAVVRCSTWDDARVVVHSFSAGSLAVLAIERHSGR